MDFKDGKKVLDPRPDLDDGIYKIALQDKFRTQDLQIIVRIRDIELTPARPTFTSKLTLEAQRNEHIVATAAYIYSSENTNTPKISFRQLALMHKDLYDFKENANTYQEIIFASMCAVFAFGLSAAAEKIARDRCFIPDSQTPGSVSLRPGRLLAWPNTLLHRLEPLSLLDRERPGHLRILLLYLVDPHYRIASTANVPPQQHEWWSDAALDRGVFAGQWAASLPMEIRQMIDEATEEWPMGRAEARRLKDEVDRERIQALLAVRGSMAGFTYTV
jgi:hypothetical protein